MKTVSLAVALAFSMCVAVITACGGDEGGVPTTEPSPTATAGEPTAAPTAADYIGVATMEEDGTIVLELRAEGPEGSIGHGIITYPPSDPQYEEILDHLGGLRPGESKPVPPWPEETDEAESGQEQ